MCKLVTVNCLSQYSGCKCILTFTEKTIAISQALFSHISPHEEEGSDDRHITCGTVMISWMCSFHWFHIFCYDSEILGWCKTEESVSFGVCCSASNVYSHSLWESTPTMHCMIIMCPIHCELMGKKKSAFKFWLFLLVLIHLGISWCWRVSCRSMLGWQLLKLGMHFISKAIV